MSSQTPKGFVSWQRTLVWGEKVRNKLDEVYKIIRGLNSTVEGLLGNASKILGDLNITQKITDWKEDIVNPVLGNISG